LKVYRQDSYARKDCKSTASGSGHLLWSIAPYCWPCSTRANTPPKTPTPTRSMMPAQAWTVFTRSSLTTRNWATFVFYKYLLYVVRRAGRRLKKADCTRNPRHRLVVRFAHQGPPLSWSFFIYFSSRRLFFCRFSARVPLCP
jgi:hypothetical protein